jgi:UDPglucose--hexose-1-phosphate uridylyltransferase
MTDLRKDELFDRCVLIAENRGDRPNEFRGDVATSAGATSSPHAACPFCAGSEHETPPPVYEKLDPLGNWQVRVVPNKYPAIVPDAPGASAGVHEVVIESPRHIYHSSQLTVAELADVLDAYRQRLQHWRGDGRFRYGVVFKNVGAAAGASLAHLHSQLMALHDVPPAIERELDQLERHQQSTGHCGVCARIREETDGRQRTVFDDDHFAVYCPWASLQPYETWIVPRAHRGAFEDKDDEPTDDRLARVLHSMLARIERVLPGAGYNVVIHTAAWDRPANGFHWRLEIRPRLTTLAGLELGTGVYINQVSPERAARRLRGD